MTCSHFDHVEAEAKSVPGTRASHAKGCEDCRRIGSGWVHLRECLQCGHAGCCDSSPHKHATHHFHATEHPTMRSVEPGEAWGWCYVDEVMVEL